MTPKDLASTLREKVTILNDIVDELERLLREAKSLGIEVHLLDGINTEVAYDLDGLSAFKLKVLNISTKMPL